jgi:hypothetical protein
MRPLFAFLGLLLSVGGASAQTAEIMDAIAKRIELAAASADAVRRCVLPGEQAAKQDPAQFDAFWAKEIDRTRKALKERLSLEDTEIERLVAPMLKRQEPFADTLPAAEVQARCIPFGRWRRDPTVLMASMVIANGSWDKPKPSRDTGGADDEKVLAAIAKAVHPWQVYASCSSLSVGELMTLPTHWSNLRKDAAAQLRGFRLSTFGTLSAHRLLDFDNLFAPTRGSWGELKAFCAANAELQQQMTAPSGPSPMVAPVEILKAVPSSR